jgi:hypothetical protein
MSRWSRREVNAVATVTREDVERAAWAASGWSRPQAAVDELLAAVDAYVCEATGGESLWPDGAVSEVEPPLVDPWEPVSEAATGEGAAEPASDEPVETATCKACGLVKPVDEFGRDSRLKSGRKPRCRPCLNEARRQAKSGDAAGSR